MSGFRLKFRKIQMGIFWQNPRRYHLNDKMADHDRVGNAGSNSGFTITGQDSEVCAECS
jgi:hypothetical protein